MKEIWKDIEGYEGLYQVSNLGRVKRVNTNRILKGNTDSPGYLQVGLCKKGIRHANRIHRLVAHAFIPNPENKLELNHIDEDKTNNRVDNLEWSTRKENINYGTRNEKVSKTMSIPVIAINIKTGEVREFSSGAECARRLSLNAAGISSVLKGRYKQTGGYTFKYKGVD